MSKTTTKTTPKEIVTDFGNRKINKQNFSKTVVLPKTALKNCSTTAEEVNIQLVQNNKEKYLKLTPIPKRKGAQNE